MKIEHQLDYSKILSTQENRLNLLLSLRGPALPDANRRNPLRIVAVLDRSPSMDYSCDGGLNHSGMESKLDRLKATMLKLIDNLTDQDQLAMVWFSDTASTKGFKTMTAAERSKAKKEVNEVHSSSATNISEALDVTCEVLKKIKDNPGTITRVLLLTDGEPTAGDCTPDGIVQRVGKLPHFAGLSCFGYGKDWNENLMSAMSQKGGGGYYFIDNLKIVTRAFATEIGGLLTCYAKNIKVALTLGKGVEFEKLLNEYSVDNKSGVVTIEAGDLYFEEDRKLVMRLRVPVAKGIGFQNASKIDLSEVTVTMDSLVDGKTVTHNGAKVTVDLVDKEADLPKANKIVAEEVAVMEAALAQTEAKTMADAGDIQGARSLLKHHLVGLDAFESGGYAHAFASLVQENLDGIQADTYCSNSVAAKSLSTSSAFALRSKRGVLGRSAASATMYNMTTPDSIKASVAKFEDDKDEAEASK